MPKLFFRGCGIPFISSTKITPFTFLLLISAIFLSFSFLSGCLSLIGSSHDYSSDYMSSLTPLEIAHPDENPECIQGKCWCMVCKNGTSIFGFATSLVGGYCYFDKDCQPQNYEFGKSTADPSLTIRQFMVGQGTSFADTSDAEGYCNNRLTMAVHWLVGTDTQPYALPRASQALCWLDKGVMPVYVLYSEGQNINLSRTEEIASVLGHGKPPGAGGIISSGPVGPVIVTTEIDYDASHAAEVAEQVRIINTACDNDRASTPQRINCLVAVAPKMGDTDALDAVMEQVQDQVDLVAYGINSHNIDATTSCFYPGAAALGQARTFSSYALYHWGKPSVIPYILFDAGGTDSSGTCTWTESSMTDGYSAFFPGGVESLERKGVIGVAPYSFNGSSFSVSNPLHCVDCAVAANNLRLRSWYGGCQAYTNISRTAPNGPTTSSPGGGTFIAFSDQPSGTCDWNAQGDWMVNSLSFGSIMDRSFINPQQPELQPGSGTSVVQCDACISESDANPFGFRGGPSDSELTTVCESYPEIRYFAAHYGVDEMLVRAFIYTESHFQPCSAADLGYCGVSGGYNRMYDPRQAGEPQAGDPNACPEFDNTGTHHYCGLGLAGSLESPYTFWPASYREDGQNGPHYDVYHDTVEVGGMGANMELAQSCNPVDFNPFNPTDSICVGAAKVAQALRAGEGDVRTYRSRGWLDWNDADQDAIFAAYIASAKYFGSWDIQTSSCSGSCTPCEECRGYGCYGPGIGDSLVCLYHAKQADIEDPSWCTNPASSPDPTYYNQANGYCYPNVVQFIHEYALDQGYLPHDIDAGWNKMGAYYGFRDRCPNSSCPSWRAISRVTGQAPTLPTTPSPTATPP